MFENEKLSGKVMKNKEKLYLIASTAIVFLFVLLISLLPITSAASTQLVDSQLVLANSKSSPMNQISNILLSTGTILFGWIG